MSRSCGFLSSELCYFGVCPANLQAADQTITRNSETYAKCTL